MRVGRGGWMRVRVWVGVGVGGLFRDKDFTSVEVGHVAKAVTAILRPSWPHKAVQMQCKCSAHASVLLLSYTLV